jgi:hypothetical protein
MKARLETNAIMSQHERKPKADVRKPPRSMPRITPTEKVELSMPDALLVNSSSIVLSLS